MPPLLTALLALALAQAVPGGPPPVPAPPPVVPVPPLVAEPRPSPPPFPSLLSAEPLRGASLLSVTAGWPRVRLAYAKGLSRTSDLGGFAELDYTTGELRAGPTYRGKVIAPAPPFEGALRLWVAWVHGDGARWLYHNNHPDQGVELGAGVSYSRRGAGGLVSLLGDVPVTITFRKTGGAYLSPRAALAYETPLFGPFTIGLQLGLGLRVGFGYAPLREGAGEVTLLGLASCRL
jgi:hypothetical protein